ncbi:MULTISPECIES: hypothetical protein [unclassified Streptomyces]|uniref:hypothetical protein n=1 Tax=unclassified Streptomyces TaxID=2593676 RepID=UPI001BE76414|nr:MULTISPECIES: hypothetical protein [unclassified Streptomyces]MBT2406747.1 hypothetical protein [Streptomyces sp. ISL-21]MBT2453808.1 hypothetical protein [Streptomyces sp. ISL-86]MBT2608977.1 hypothetical protein [Streptomyces sp. ISL-87]
MAGEQQHEHKHKHERDRDDEHEHMTVAPQAGREQQVCPACGRPVETVVRRRKSLGIYIPEWVPGPCRNPDCPRYVLAEG